MRFPSWIWLLPMMAGLVGYIVMEILLDKVRSITIRIKMKGGKT